MSEDWRLQTLDFKTAKERDEYIINNSDYFTVVRHLGPRRGYERHEVKTLVEAETLARRMAKEAGKPYIIYAVAGLRDAMVGYVDQEGNRR